MTVPSAGGFGQAASVMQHRAILREHGGWLYVGA